MGEQKAANERKIRAGDAGSSSIVSNASMYRMMSVSLTFVVCASPPSSVLDPRDEFAEREIARAQRE
jgi:hypothetical protein